MGSISSPDTMADSKRPIVAITMGDPAGIGAEVIVKAYQGLLNDAAVFVVGDADVVRRAVDVCDVPHTVREISEVAEAQFDPTVIDVLDLDEVDAATLEYGVVRRAYGAASLAYVECAIDLALDGTVDAITTAPINKQATELAGADYVGHTGLLADRTNTETYSMMLIEDDLRVTHVSTHVPLREACDLVTTENVLEVIKVTDDALRELGVTEPRIAVAGLNPHAGDGGVLGDADDEEIRPAVEGACDVGIDAFGPESPDTVYVRAVRGEADCVVSMYHDQGHIPIKMLGFSAEGAVSGVNMTVGLPIVRTSVDHGTAFDIAGKGIADATSLADAVAVAARASESRQ